MGNRDTSVRDHALLLWGDRQAAVLGSWKYPRPLHVRNLLIWDKTDGVGPGMGDHTAVFGNSHEEIYLLGYWPRLANKRRGSVIRTSDGLRSLSGRTGHPTPKPVGLMSTILELVDGSATVADPFSGSGATLIAAKQLGLRVIGVEVNEAYCEYAAKELASMGAAQTKIARPDKSAIDIEEIA